MRIALVIEEYDPHRGGAEQWTWQFARQTANWGHEVHVVARRFAPVFDHRIVRHYVPKNLSRSQFAGAAEAKVRSLPVDVIHDTGCGWHANVFQPHGGSRVAAFNQNLLLLPHWARRFKTQASRWLPRYREFDHLTARQYARDGRVILAVSNMVAHDVQRFHNVPRERIRVVHNGVDTLRFTPANRDRHREAVRDKLGVGDHEVLFLIVAHNYALKGVATLVRAVARLHDEGRPVRLAVVGGKRQAAYERLAERLGVGRLVSFVGSVGDPTPYYAAADAYVQPTFYDPCSLVALEALASGLPVVTTRYNGAGELIEEGAQGFVTHDPADDEELADRLLPLFDPNTRIRMSQAARKLALSHTLERNCREVLAVYQESTAYRRRAA